MNLEELSGRRVALLGIGADVSAAIPSVLAVGPAEVVVVVDSDDQRSGAPVSTAATDAAVTASADVREAHVEVAGNRLPVVTLAEAAESSETFVRSPGFPRYLPELVAAIERGARMTTPIDLFIGGLDPATRVVLVTGTKGKSTTTSLLRRFASEAGIHMGVAGNLGIPVFMPGWNSNAPVIVLEVSSYQAADLHHVPDIAVVTSLAEDHLSWHGGIERYLHDKLRVVSNDGGTATAVVVPSAEIRAREVIADLFPTLDPILVDDPHFDGLADRARAQPKHRLRNAALAAKVIDLLGGRPITPEQLLAAAASSMPGRLDPLDVPQGCRLGFVDDALASNPSATAAGLGWARSQHSDVIVILGGENRGVSVTPLLEEAAFWNDDEDLHLRAIALPVNGNDLATRCGIELLATADSVHDAVALAVDAAEPTDLVLFSPAAPTPPGAGNWRTRSNEFRSAVSELVGPKMSHPGGEMARTELDESINKGQL